MTSPGAADPARADPLEPRGYAGRIPLGGRTLRQHAARGTLVNGGFQVGVVTLNLLKGLVVAAFLSVSDFGLWGILTVTVMSFAWLKQVGVGDKFVQQSEPDQRVAFQRAFTLELCFAVGFVALCAALLPLISIAYGDSRIVAPGILLAVALALSAFQAPLWILYRRMQFTRYRALQSVDPVASFIVTVSLAAAGGGYWSLVVGALAGAVAGSVVAVATSPYPLALQLDRPTTREYVGFSAPLVVASLASLVIAQGSIFAAEAHLGLAAAGAIALAVTIAHYSDRVDEIVTASLYPAICAVTDQRDLLREVFVKSNRLALIWAVPFGVGIALFAAPLVHHVLGDKWAPAIVLLQVFGLTAGLGHIGFNWTAFYRAIGDTRPIAIWSVAAMITFLAVAVPLLLTHGLAGFAGGIAAMTVTSLVVRGVYLARLFGSATVVLHTVRAIAPSVPAVALVLGLRLVAGGDGAARALVELALYLVVTAVATAILERSLLAEALAYLRRPREVGPAA
ncbi:MAG: oligosaccharide flippase family protein [Thermoleophilaceae bacterium]